MRSRSVLAAVVISGLAVAAVACDSSSTSSNPSSHRSTVTTAEVSPAGDIPDDQAFVTFTPPSGGYAIQVPEGWARTDLPTGATFTDKLNSIRVEAGAAPTTPTEASVRADEIPGLRSETAGFVLGSITTVARTAGDALLITYRATGAPDSVTGKRVTQDVERYEFWMDGTLVTITLTSPKGADNVDPWKTVTDSLVWQT